MMAVDPLWPMNTTRNVFAFSVLHVDAGGSTLYAFSLSLVGRTNRPSLGSSTAEVVEVVIVVVLVGACVVVMVVLVVVVLVSVVVDGVAVVASGGEVGGCAVLASLLMVRLVSRGLSAADGTLCLASGWTATLTVVVDDPGESLPI